MKTGLANFAGIVRLLFGTGHEHTTPCVKMPVDFYELVSGRPLQRLLQCQHQNPGLPGMAARLLARLSPDGRRQAHALAQILSDVDPSEEETGAEGIAPRAPRGYR